MQIPVDVQEKVLSSYGVIYKLTNTVNGKIYVGQQRIRKQSFHEVHRYRGSGTVLAHAKKKYGDVFDKEYVAFASSHEELNQLEREWIRQLDSRNPKVGYNVEEGGYHDLDTDTGDPMVFMSKDGISRKVLESQVDFFKQNGWKLGLEGRAEDQKTRWANKDYKKRVSIAISAGSKAACAGREFLWISKEGESIRIEAKDLATYLEQGWTEGRETGIEGLKGRNAGFTWDEEALSKRIKTRAERDEARKQDSNYTSWLHSQKSKGQLKASDKKRASLLARRDDPILKAKDSKKIGAALAARQAEEASRLDQGLSVKKAWIHKDGEVKRVWEDDVASFLILGWERGRK